MRKLPKYDDLTGQQKKIHDILRLFVLYCNTGLLPFFGEAHFPEAEILYEMKTAQYIDRYKKLHHGATPQNISVKKSNPLAYAQRVAEVADSIEQIIRDAGGLDTFKAAFAELLQTHSRNMIILRDLSRRTGSLDTIATIAERNWLSDPQITNIKNRMLITLAINISGRVKADTWNAESKKAG